MQGFKYMNSMPYFENVLKWVKKDWSVPKDDTKCPAFPPMMKKPKWISDRSLASNRKCFEVSKELRKVYE